MIRKLDLYFVKHFLFAFITTVFILTGLFLVVDFFSKLKPFLDIEQTSTVLFILAYYAYRIPIYLIDLMPIILLIAAMLTITRFVKTNEMTTMLVGGLSAKRIILPIFVLASIFAFMIFLLGETYIPLLEKKLSETDKILRFEGYERYLLTQDSEKNSILVEKYIYTQKKMDKLKMIKFDSSGLFQSTITAEYGYWRDSSDSVNPFGKNGWIVYNGVAYLYEKNGIRKKIEKFGQEGYYLETSLTPTELERSEKSLTYMGLSEINDLISQYPHRDYLKMKWYNKFVVPISFIIILLLGIPFVMMSEANNLFIGIGICLIINILFFATQFFFGNLGNQGTISPFLAAVIPIILFASLGLHFLRKIRT